MQGWHKEELGDSRKDCTAAQVQILCGIWMADKLKPFGFAIHGCIDGFSRRMMWLHVASSYNNPSKIAEYYLACAENLGHTAQILRWDMGTKTFMLPHLHPFLVDPAANARVVFGRSTANQRIEAWWSILRRSVTNWWMNLFKDLRDLNFYNDGCVIQVQCLKYCFMEVIQSDLNTFMSQWNCPQIRKQRKSELSAGKPDVIYLLHNCLERGTRSYKLSVVKEDAARCRILFDKPRSEFIYLEDFETLACEVITNIIQPSDDAVLVLRLYLKLLLALGIIT